MVTEKNSIEKDYSNENYGTFPSAVVDNPWFSDHIHQNGDDPLGMNYLFWITHPTRKYR